VDEGIHSNTDTRIRIEILWELQQAMQHSKVEALRLLLMMVIVLEWEWKAPRLLSVF